MEHEGESDTNCNWSALSNPQIICKGSEKFGNKRTSKYHKDYSIIKINQNTERSPGDLKSLALTQTFLKNYYLISKNLTQMQ